MPPKVKQPTDQGESHKKPVTGADSSTVEDASAEIKENPQQTLSTATHLTKPQVVSSIEKHSPAIPAIAESSSYRVPPDSIFERSFESDPIVYEINNLQEAGVTFGKILLFHISKRLFTEDQRKNLLFEINKVRQDRIPCSSPTNYKASKKDSQLKFSEEEISAFCDILKKDESWNFKVFKKNIKSESEGDTSSNSEMDINDSKTKSPRQSLRRSPRQHQGTPRSQTWKEFKRGQDFESAYFRLQVEHPGVKKVIKKIVKLIWRKKKQGHVEKKNYSAIDVSKEEVQDLLFEVAGFLERTCLKQTIPTTQQINPPEKETFESENTSACSGNQDETLPSNRSSNLKEASLLDPTSSLQKCDLLDIIIATLLMTLNDNDPNQEKEFVDILKMPWNCVPDKYEPMKRNSGKVKHASGSTVVCYAHVEPPPDLERLERTGAKGYLKQIPDEESELKSFATGVKDRLEHEFGASQLESLIKIDSNEACADIKYIDESSAEENEDQLQPEASEQFKRDRSPESPDSQSKKITNEP